MTVSDGTNTLMLPVTIMIVGTGGDLVTVLEDTDKEGEELPIDDI